MKTLFIAAGPYAWGSSRMRAFWIERHMENAYTMQFEDFMKVAPSDDLDFDAYVYQKVFDIERALWIREIGAKVYWDVCDPSWWFQPQECFKIIECVDGVVASNIDLANDFTEWSGMPCSTIPDRLDFDHFPQQREHDDHKPVRFIWYGVSVNRLALFAALANLERLSANGYSIELTIFDDRPEHQFRISDKFPIYQLKWNLDRENEVLASHDIALLPQYPGPWGRVKSNNKMLTAWACNLPVTDAEFYDEMVMMVESAEKRHNMAARLRNVIRDAYDVRKSASQWERLLDV